MKQYQSNNELGMLLDLIAIAEETGISETEYFINEVNKLSYRWDDFRYQKLIQKCLTSDSLPSLINRLFRIPVTDNEKTVLGGDYAIGTVAETDIKVGLSRKALQLHTLISGATGFGKTNNLNVLADSIQKAGGRIIQWFIDPKTSMGDFRWQIKKYPNTIAIPLSVLRLNPFAPIKNVPRKALMEKAIEVLSDSFNVLDASQGVVSEHVEKVFQREEVPCFKDVADSILSEKTTKFGRRQGYLDTLEVRLKTVQMSLGEVFACRNDYFDQLYDSNVIFEVGGISDLAQKVIVPFIIMKLSLYKTYNPTGYLSHILYFEEAQGAVFSKLLEMRARTPTVAALATQARSYGMGLVVLCQNPITKIITEMLSNSANLICFHVGGTEIKGMIECMGLSTEQAMMLQHIQVGEALFKTSMGYTEPLHIMINMIDNTPPSDSEVKNLMKPKWNELLGHITPVQKKSEIKVEKTIETFSSSNKQPSKHSSLKSDETGNKSCLKPDDEILLKDVQLRPYEFTEERYKQGTLSRNRAIKAKERLCRFGFLEDVKFKIGRRGKPPSILRFTEKAVTHLNILPEKGKGSLEHQWWQRLIVHLAKQNGLKAKLEDMGADVSISNNSEYVALEVTLHDSNIIQNIERNFQNGFSQVWLAVRNEAMLKKVNNAILDISLMNDKIKVFLLNKIILKIKEFCNDKTATNF